MLDSSSLFTVFFLCKYWFRVKVSEILLWLLFPRVSKICLISLVFSFCFFFSQLIKRDGELDNSALHIAAISNSKNALKIMELLIHHRKYLIDKTNSNGRTPIHEAAKACRTDNVKFLMSHGSKLQTKDKEGEICLSDIIGKTPRSMEVSLMGAYP